MAPSFDHLREADLDDDEFDDDEIDVSDLREKYEVQLDQGYDTFVVIDGLPEVTEDQKPKLIKFLLKKLNQVGKPREDSVFMPMGDNGKSLRLVQTRYLSSDSNVANHIQIRVCRVLVSRRSRSGAIALMRPSPAPTS
jgi:translation initiation factor 3 subunit B